MNGNKERNVFGGFDQWAANFPLLNTMMHFLQWFTVPAETLLRRDFGQRWYTKINFYAGLLILLWYNLMQQAGGAFGRVLGGFAMSLNQRSYTDEEPSLFDTFLSNSMLWVLLAYLALGSYHFFKIRWRNYNRIPLHSFDDGTSRLIVLGAGFMDLVNLIAKPISIIYMKFLTARERKNADNLPPLYTDVIAFTDTFFEPFFLFVLAIIFGVVGGGTTAIWLLLSSFSLAIFSNWKHTANLNRLLDIRDNMVESVEMQMAMKGKPTQRITAAQKEIVAHIAEKVEETPAVAEQVKADFPDLDDIIAQMHDKPKS
ncbi:MAG: hypothetical protein JNL70_07080 [Saprospiraceae bacterium]|nr:hypothetical protein [Saprospiraceae bacterium]